MFHTPWLRNFLNGNRSRKDRRREARNRKPVRLVLESLEERLTPSGPQTAGSYTDLVNAIATDTGTNTNYVIDITNSFQFNSGGQVSITQLGSGSTLTIEGQNGTNFTLTGNGNRLFTIGSGQNVTFTDLTLTGGGGVSMGGAVLDQGGNVTLSNVAVLNNTVSGSSAEGGGIFASGNGTLTIQGGSAIQSNRAIGTGFFTTANGVKTGNSASGGGLYVLGASTVQISDSSIDKNIAQGAPGADATAAGTNGTGGGLAQGGGVYVSGSGWNVTLTGDTLSGNAAIGGNGGNGAAGGNATGTSATGGNGGNGGDGGNGWGGAADFLATSTSGGGTGTLTILNDSANPSILIGNSATGGSGGAGGNGGTSTGTADNSNGGNGGNAGKAVGGALVIETNATGTVTVNIGNTTLYGNTATGGNGGAGGAAGTGGSGAAGTAGTNQVGGAAVGGGMQEAVGGTFTVVNSTVANNTAAAGLNGGGTTQNTAATGGGIFDNSSGTVIFDNNTITQNTVSGAFATAAAGLAITNTSPTLLNNLIQGNQSIGLSVPDLGVAAGITTPLPNATNNFIGTISANAVDTTTNIVGNTQTQLGSVVGVDANGNPTGGPIYYPLLPGVVSIGAGTTSVLDTIAGVEGTTPANATDEIGNPRSSNNSIDLGAVQSFSAPTVTTNPSDQTVTAGGTVSFTAAASGNPVPTVQWQVSIDGGQTFTDISGATSTTLTLNNVTASMNGYEYQAVFTNSLGSATTTAATLTVQFAPTITTNPSDQTVTAGGTVSFTAAATGNSTPTVQWQVSTDGGQTFTDISGATSTTLTLNNVTATMNGEEFQAVFTNSIGSATTTAATLTVQFAPTVTTNPSDQTVTAGNTATFTASASGNPTPTVQWQVSSDGGKTFTNINGATSTTLTLTNVTAAMNGEEFQAVFTNSVGSATSAAATLTVQAAPTITSANSAVFTVGQNGSFTVTATGSPAPTLTLSGPLPSGLTFKDNGNGTATLAGTPAAGTQGNYYFAITAHNGVGSDFTQNFALTVNAAPPQPPALQVPPLLGFINLFLTGTETVNTNGTVTVTYSLFGFTLISANYDSSGTFVSASLLGFPIPNFVWFI